LGVSNFLVIKTLMAAWSIRSAVVCVPELWGKLRRLWTSGVRPRCEWALYASVSLFIKMVKVILITQDYVNKKKTSAGERHLDHIWWASLVAWVVKNSPASAGDEKDLGLIPGLERSPGGGHGNPLQYSCLENPMDGGAWRAVVHKVVHNWSGSACAHTVHSCPVLTVNIFVLSSGLFSFSWIPRSWIIEAKKFYVHFSGSSSGGFLKGLFQLAFTLTIWEEFWATCFTLK